MMTAAYFTLNNPTDFPDSLLSLTTEIANDAQIHESFETEDGMMGMRPVGLIPIGSKSSVELKPGGIHIMVIHPYDDIVVGDSVNFLLQFAKAGDIEVRLPVSGKIN